MKIILAQGNPGLKYQHTRHNVGFMALDAFAANHNVSFTHKSKFNADIAELAYNEEKILLVKPATFYNETGNCAQQLIDFYKLNPTSDLLVLHDELALPFGIVRTRLSGSDAGNNGVKSLNSHLGTDYARIRIGIASLQGMNTDPANFVLGTFTQDEKNTLADIFIHVDHFIEQFLKVRFESTSRSLSLP